MSTFDSNPIQRAVSEWLHRRCQMTSENVNVIANLSKGKIGHDKANLLGSLLTTQFQLDA